MLWNAALSKLINMAIDVHMHAAMQVHKVYRQVALFVLVSISWLVLLLLVKVSDLNEVKPAVQCLVTMPMHQRHALLSFLVYLSFPSGLHARYKRCSPLQQVTSAQYTSNACVTENCSC